MRLFGQNRLATIRHCACPGVEGETKKRRMDRMTIQLRAPFRAYLLPWFALYIRTWHFFVFKSPMAMPWADMRIEGVLRNEKNLQLSFQPKGHQSSFRTPEIEAWAVALNIVWSVSTPPSHFIFISGVCMPIHAPRRTGWRIAGPEWETFSPNDCPLSPHETD